MFRCLWDVHNKYKAELVVSSLWWMKEMITVFTETSDGHKLRPSRSFATFMVWTRQMVARVNSHVFVVYVALEFPSNDGSNNNKNTTGKRKPNPYCWFRRASRSTPALKPPVLICECGGGVRSSAAAERDVGECAQGTGPGGALISLTCVNDDCAPTQQQ